MFGCLADGTWASAATPVTEIRPAASSPAAIALRSFMSGTSRSNGWRRTAGSGELDAAAQHVAPAGVARRVGHHRVVVGGLVPDAQLVAVVDGAERRGVGGAVVVAPEGGVLADDGGRLGRHPRVTHRPGPGVRADDRAA